MTDWQPRETAPKDGTTILAVHKVSREVIPVKFTDRYPGARGTGMGVYLVDDGNITHGYVQWDNITHWVPLPEAPK